MEFLDRSQESARLDALVAQGRGTAIVWGRRRLGKTRLLLEWVRRHGGLYWVADESSATVHRRFFAQALAAHLPGFADTVYPDWSGLFSRLAQEAGRWQWQGPLVIDELPYLHASSPEILSILQRFIDHDVPRLKVCLALAGSSQQMMQGVALQASSPLYGRAQQILHIRPLPAGYIGKALRLRTPRQQIEAYTLWGGVPRYWELAAAHRHKWLDAADALVLDPLGPLSQEPQRLLRDEIPSATSLRPVLDVIGMGNHRVTDIASRLGQPASSLAGPLVRLQQLSIIARETPFGTSERATKRALYRISCPFLRWWFRVVGPRQSLLAQTTPAVRRHLLQQAFARLCAEAWEELCRAAVPRLKLRNADSFGLAQRFWHGQGYEWDVVASTLDHKSVMVGEAKWTERNPTAAFVEKTVKAMLHRGIVPGTHPAARPLYVLFVPSRPKDLAPLPKQVRLVDAATVLAALH